MSTGQAPGGGMSRDELEAEVARLRAESDVRAAGGDLGGGRPLEIDRSHVAYTPPPPAPVAPQGRAETADEQVDRMLAEQAAAEVEDFGAFWSEQAGGKRLTNIGSPPRDLQLPRGMPLRFQMESERLQRSERIEDVRYLFDMLYGAGTWDDLVDRGLDTAQLPVLLVWATQNLGGKPTTLAEAAAAHARMTAEQAAKKAAGDAGAEGNASAAA